MRLMLSRQCYLENIAGFLRSHDLDVHMPSIALPTGDVLLLLKNTITVMTYSADCRFRCAHSAGTALAAQRKTCYVVNAQVAGQSDEVDRKRI